MMRSSVYNPMVSLKKNHLGNLLGMVELERFVWNQFREVQFSPAVWIALGLLNEDLEKSASVYHLQSKKDTVLIFLYGYYLQLTLMADNQFRDKFDRYFSDKKYRELHARMEKAGKTHDIPSELIAQIQAELSPPQLTTLATVATENVRPVQVKLEFVKHLLFQVIPNQQIDDFEKIKSYRHELAGSDPTLTTLIDSFVAQVLNINAVYDANNFDAPDYSKTGDYSWTAYWLEKKVFVPLYDARGNRFRIKDESYEWSGPWREAHMRLSGWQKRLEQFRNHVFQKNANQVRFSSVTHFLQYYTYDFFINSPALSNKKYNAASNRYIKHFLFSLNEDDLNLSLSTPDLKAHLMHRINILFEIMLRNNIVSNLQTAFTFITEHYDLPTQRALSSTLVIDDELFPSHFKQLDEKDHILRKLGYWANLLSGSSSAFYLRELFGVKVSDWKQRNFNIQIDELTPIQKTLDALCDEFNKQKNKIAELKGRFNLAPETVTETTPYIAPISRKRKREAASSTNTPFHIFSIEAEPPEKEEQTSKRRKFK